MAVPARRARAAAPETPPPNTNLGLWLDRYLPTQPERNTRADAGLLGTFLNDAASRDAPEGYSRAFERWKSTVQAWPNTLLLDATAIGRVIIGLGAKGPTETGISVHFAWGVPYLPGSALKGVAAAAARRLTEGWTPQSLDYQTLFGTHEASAAVDFLDAWWVPPGRPLALDVMTVHHAAYFQGGSEFPSDADSPNPVSFVSARGRFLVVLQGPDAWVEAAARLLAIGLAELGIGAKTNAGYGRIRLDLGGIERRAAERAAPRLAAEAAERQQEREERAREAETTRLRQEADARAALAAELASAATLRQLVCIAARANPRKLLHALRQLLDGAREGDMGVALARFDLDWREVRAGLVDAGQLDALRQAGPAYDALRNQVLPAK